MRGKAPKAQGECDFEKNDKTERKMFHVKQFALGIMRGE
jgi:hypothetical protein